MCSLLWLLRFVGMFQLASALLTQALLVTKPEHQGAQQRLRSTHLLPWAGLAASAALDAALAGCKPAQKGSWGTPMLFCSCRQSSLWFRDIDPLSHCSKHHTGKTMNAGVLWRDFGEQRASIEIPGGEESIWKTGSVWEHSGQDQETLSNIQKLSRAGTAIVLPLAWGWTSCQHSHNISEHCSLIQEGSRDQFCAQKGRQRASASEEPGAKAGGRAQCVPAQAHTRRSQPRRQGGNAGSFLLLELPTGVCPPVSGRRNRLARPVAMKKAFWGSFHKTGGGKSHWSRRGESRVGMPGPLQWGKMWEDGLREYLGHSRISNTTHAGASDVSKAWFSKKIKMNFRLTKPAGGRRVQDLLRHPPAPRGHGCQGLLCSAEAEDWGRESSENLCQTQASSGKRTESNETLKCERAQ